MVESIADDEWFKHNADIGGNRREFVLNGPILRVDTDFNVKYRFDECDLQCLLCGGSATTSSP